MKFTKYLIVFSLLTFFTFGLMGSVSAGEDVVSFNKSTVEELMSIELVDIPRELAESIVEYREEHGPFKTPDELSRVPGMTQDFLEELNPVMHDGDVVFDPMAEPALAPSKC